MAISEGSWDGSAGRFTDEQYQRSCVLDRKACGGDWVDKPPKIRCSLPIREPNGDLNRAGVHAVAGRLSSVTTSPESMSAAKSKLRSAYKELGEDPPASLKRSERPDNHRDRALASYEHEWEFRDSSDKGYLGTLAGHFAVFNKWTEINSPLEGHFMERVAPGSFSKTFLENRKNMRVLLNHGKDPSVGMKPLGPIRHLEQDSTGAYYEVELLDTSYNRDLVPGLKEGQYGASFRFKVMREEFNQFPERSEANPLGLPTSTITEAKVREFGPVTFGQYEEATAGLRSLNDELVGIDLGLMARSDPQVIASFARILSANVGTTMRTQEPEEETEVRDEPAEAPEQPRETTEEAQVPTGLLRDNASAADWSIAYCLANLKGDLAYTKAKQLADVDADDDPDDAAVSAALDAIDAAIDAAIKAQAKDGDDDDNEEESDEQPEMAYAGPRSDSSAEEEHESAPANRAPVHSPKPFGSTLTKRAAPLKVNRKKGEPQWKL